MRVFNGGNLWRLRCGLGYITQLKQDDGILHLKRGGDLTWAQTGNNRPQTVGQVAQIGPFQPTTIHARLRNRQTAGLFREIGG